jgi:hypothetical protein
MAPFFNDQINGFRAGEFHVGACSVDVGVVGNDVSLFAGDSEQDALGGASLVRGDYVLVAEDLLDGFFEVIEAFAAGVTLVAFHDAGPLVGRHCSRAGVGEQVDENVFGGKQKEVVERGLE